jgi:pimeloyl-ACP methyl ester carboxylesterase
LVVFLPGRSDTARSFDSNGFIAEARAAGVEDDMIAVDAHIGYYLTRSIIDRLWLDVVRPAMESHRPVWLVGISLGGFGAVAFAGEHPESVEGLVVIAPYLGPDDVIDEIGRAGGLRHWSPPAAPGDFRKQWVWLQGYSRPQPARPPLYLAYGDADRYAAGHRALAAVLPAERVLVTPGGHDWRAWRTLWKSFLTMRVLSNAKLPAT